VLALAAVVVPGVLVGGHGSATGPVTAASGSPPPSWPQDGRAFPAPGGGPVAVHVYETGGRSYLLDPDLGRYRPLDLEHVRLSPDLRYAAVTAGDGRVGIAERAVLLHDGEAAIRWLDEPGDLPEWSPDGKAFAYTAVAKAGTSVWFRAVRYEVATRAVTSTQLPSEMLGTQLGWTADSRGYLVLLPVRPAAEFVEPAAIQQILPTGKPGARWYVRGGLPGGARWYSPSRAYLVTDASGLMSAHPIPSPVLSAGTGAVVAVLPERAKPVGWYDDRTVVALDPEWRTRPALLFVSVDTGQVIRRLDLPGTADVSDLQLGPAHDLTGTAAGYGF
jgi:hypothetical protein